MDPFQISKEPAYYRWIDGIVLLIIGVVTGLVISQGLNFFQMTTTTSEVIRNVPLVRPETQESGNVMAPQNYIRFEDI